MRAGASMQKITPRMFTHLAGSEAGVFRPCETVMDDLYAKAVVIEGNGVTYAVICLDVTMVTEKYCDMIRAEVSRSLGMPREAVLVYCTQTHSAPGVGCFMYDESLNVELTPETEYLSGTTEEYSGFAAEMSVKAAIEAAGNMERVYAATGRSFADRLAFNRRMIRRDGTMVMPGLWPGDTGPTDYLYYEGPADPEVSVMSLINEKMDMVAMLMHFTCHPVNGFINPATFHAVTSDWCGAWCEQTRREYPGCVPVVLNGACGNLNPWDPFEPGFTLDHRRMGAKLMEATRRIIGSSRAADINDVRYETRTIPLEYRDIPKDRLEYARETVTGSARLDEGLKKADRDWYLALSTMSAVKRKELEPLFRYEIHALRLGNTAVLGLPGEPFVEGQLELKKRCAAGYLMVAHCAGRYVGYLPTESAYAYDAHETNYLCTNWAKLKPGSLEAVVRNAREMIDGLYRDQ